MGCCETLLRMLLIIVNIVILAIGVVMLATGIIFKLGKEDYLPALSEYSTSMGGISLFTIIVGAVVAVVGLVGCMGAITKKNGVLNFYFIIILLTLVLQVALIIYTILQRDSVINNVTKAATETFKLVKEKTATENQKLAINSLQSAAKCCGLDGKDYWDTTGMVPAGCCENYDAKSTKWTCPYAGAYSAGCLDAVPAKVKDNAISILVVVVIIIFVEIVCLAAACYSKKQDLIA